MRPRAGLLVRYVVTGFAAFGIDTVITLTGALFVHFLIANTLGFVIANAAQFVVVHRWVFGKRFETRSIVPLYLATLGISLAGLGLSTAIVYGGVAWLGLSLFHAKVLAAGAGLMFNLSLRMATVYR